MVWTDDFRNVNLPVNKTHADISLYSGSGVAWRGVAVARFIR